MLTAAKYTLFCHDTFGSISNPSNALYNNRTFHKCATYNIKKNNTVIIEYLFNNFLRFVSVFVSLPLLYSQSLTRNCSAK